MPFIYIGIGNMSFCEPHRTDYGVHYWLQWFVSFFVKNTIIGLQSQKVCTYTDIINMSSQHTLSISAFLSYTVFNWFV